MIQATLPPGLAFRPMSPQDLECALRVIRQVNPEDAENARKTYARGLDCHYVFTHDGQVIGLTGLGFADGTDNTWWLSWTYVEQAYHGGGISAMMLQQLLAELRLMEARKVFVNISETRQWRDSELYAEVNQAYREVGFIEELRYPDFYQVGEGRLTLGLHLNPPDTPPVVPSHQQHAFPTDYDEIPETDDAYYIEWEFSDQPVDQQPWLEIISEIRSEQGRVVFLGIAQDAAEVQRMARRLGFLEVGRMRDFYEDGVDEVHFRYNLKQ